MFFTFTHEDPYNHSHKRNRYNTAIRNYNCGGFALGTYSWYEPFDESERYDVYEEWDNLEQIAHEINRHDENEPFNRACYFSCIELLTRRFTNHILKDFPNCRVVNELKEVRPDETIVLFRVGVNDFHFVVSFDHKHWFHKCGWDSIEELCEDEIFDHDWSNGRYNGRIVKFAMRG